jgi:hypothetical protein
MVDGVVGKNTWAELEKMINAISVKPSESSYRVIISGLDLTQAKALQANYPGSEIKGEPLRTASG